MAETAALYTLRDWVWTMDLMSRARFVRECRPFVGLNPALERVSNG